MKVVAKPIEVIAWFDKEGIHPIRFRLKDGEVLKVIKIEKVMYNFRRSWQGTKCLHTDVEAE